MKRVAIATLGCKTNAFESASIMDGFSGADFYLVPFEEEADIYIINTCTVTNRTDFKSRNLIRKALSHKERNPAVRVVVTGCFAQRSYDEVHSLGKVDLVIDNQSKLDIASLLDSSEERFEDIMQAREYSFRPVKGMVEHSRAFQKIQDGCDYRCTYCAVPYARGHSRSATLEDILSQARLFVQNGYKEIVLGGVNLGLYKEGDIGLSEVVKSLQELDGLELIRLSSLEPQLLTSAILRSFRECSKVCPHFHIPLQSGCESVLRRMGRHYTTSEFTELIENIIELYPDAAIGLDVITGFPGETEEEFANTVELLESLPIAYLHVFSYSKRKDTPAAQMPNQIPGPIKTQRTGVLTALSTAKKEAYTALLIKRKQELRGVCESITDGWGTFLSDHYIRCYLQNPPPQGAICKVIPTQSHLDGVR